MPLIASSLSRCSRWGLTAVLAACLVACASIPPRLPDFVATIEHAAPGVMGIGDGTDVLGSGFRLAGSQWVVTAAHVVRNIRGTPVVTWSSRTFPARLLRVDDAADLALLEIDADSPMPGLHLASHQTPPTGQWIVVLGCPFGAAPTASVGVISAPPGAIQQPPELRGRLQLNAAVNPGNSGGPVVDLEGRVVGIANATVPGGFGIGFAVPVADLARLLADEKTGR